MKNKYGNIGSGIAGGFTNGIELSTDVYNGNDTRGWINGSQATLYAFGMIALLCPGGQCLGIWLITKAASSDICQSIVESNKWK